MNLRLLPERRNPFRNEAVVKTWGLTWRGGHRLGGKICIVKENSDGSSLK